MSKEKEKKHKTDWNGCNVNSKLARFNACLSLTKPKTIEQLLKESGINPKRLDYDEYMFTLEMEEYVIGFFAEDDPQRKTMLYKLNPEKFKKDGVLKDALDEFVEYRDNRQLAECLKILVKRKIVSKKTANKILEDEVIPKDNIKYWGRAIL
jgi:hypothetical protein